jgi:hypothetical protein
MPQPPQSDVPAQVRQELEALRQPRPIRRGSLSERYMKCSKPGCACAEDPDARHGPYFSLTRGVQGSTRSRLVSAEQAQIVRSQIEAGQDFRRQVSRLQNSWAQARPVAAHAFRHGASESKLGARTRIGGLELRAEVGSRQRLATVSARLPPATVMALRLIE